MTTVKDADGKFFMREIIEGAQTKGKGWCDYKWTNPNTKVVEAKTAYYQRVDEFFIGCGACKR
jgi:cytochrome c